LKAGHFSRHAHRRIHRRQRRGEHAYGVASEHAYGVASDAADNLHLAGLFNRKTTPEMPFCRRRVVAILPPLFVGRIRSGA
jgi:hypothetical protein